jgi:epoxyqueuosine reductase
MKISQELAEESPFKARPFLDGKDAMTLATDILALDQATFSAAFKGSPMKRAKLRGLQRNAAVVLGNAGTAKDVDVFTNAVATSEPLVREHAAWALGRPVTEASDASGRVRGR